jgi:hypothetical protein
VVVGAVFSVLCMVVLLVGGAEQARAEAEAATLEHVRERCRRSEAAWEALADKARRSERLREQEAERRAAAGQVG